MTDPVKPAIPAIPATPVATPAPAPTQAPAPAPAPATALAPAPAKSVKPAKKVDRIKLRGILVDKGVATTSLAVEDAQGLTTTLPDKVVPVWKASDPRIALTPSAGGFKISVAAGKVTEEIDSVSITATVTLPDPDNRVLTATNDREPMSVRAVGGGTGTFEMRMQ